MLSDRCPVCLSDMSVLSVTLVHCGQMVGWIKMKLGMQVGLCPVHIVLDGDPAPFAKGAQAPIFGPYLLWPNGCMDQDATWHGGRPRPRRLCVRWGSRSRPQKGGAAPQIFGPCLLWPNGWMDQDGTWHGCISLSPGDFVLDGDTDTAPQKTDRATSPIFSPFPLWTNGWMHQDAT